jgi:hypothetical protein
VSRPGCTVLGGDLRDGFDLTQDDVPVAFDLVFLHPPYFTAIPYSGNMWGSEPDPRDLSQCESYTEFLDKLDDAQFRVYDALRSGGILAVLIGDVRKTSVLYPISRDMRWYGDPVAQVIKVQHNVTSARTQYSGSFIELAHEYLVLTRKPQGWTIPVRVTQVAQVDLIAQSWRNIVQTALETLDSVGHGAHMLADIYRAIADHPRVLHSQQVRQDWQAKVRQTLQMYSQVFTTVGRGQWQLAVLGA